MKTTEHFKHTIETYLRDRAETDELFAVSFSNPEKNLDDCITYILNTVKQSGCCGFSDEEIYSIATHYFDEIGLEIGSPINCNVIVNHTLSQDLYNLCYHKKSIIKRSSFYLSILQWLTETHLSYFF